MRHPAKDIVGYTRLFQKYLGNRIYLVMPLSMLSSLFESIGILMIIPLIENITGHNDEELEGVNLYLNNTLAYLGISNSVFSVFIVIALAFIIKAVFTFYLMKYIALLRAELLSLLKSKMYDGIIGMSYSYYVRKDTGHFVNTINEQVNRTLISFSALMQFSALLVSVIVYLVLVLLVSWEFAVIVLFLSSAVLVTFTRLNIKIRTLSRDIAKENGILESLLIKNIHLFKYIKATGANSLLRPEIDVSISKLANQQAITAIAAGFIRTIREPVAAIIILVSLYIEVIILARPIGPIIVAIFLLYRGINTIFAIQKKFIGMLSVVGSLEQVDNEFTNLNENQNNIQGVSIERLSQSIVLRNVFFSYQNIDSYEVYDANLSLKANTSLAIIGKSGSGKSTLVEIISQLHQPQKGEVYIDGVPLSDINCDSWHRQIGYVSQDLDIINGTVAENITLFNGDISTDLKLLERVSDVCRMTLADEFIQLLPDGYNTVIGDVGVALSAGQKQRLFIARELFKEPSLLILDEATNALDSLTQRAVSKTISELRGNVTLIIIAHRLSTIRNADKVIVMDSGRIIEQGHYSSLSIDKESMFREFLDSE